MSTPRRWLLFVSLLLIGIAYLVAFAFFVADSDDFLARRINTDTRGRCARIGVPADAILRFGSGGNGTPCLGSGWHGAESSGTWSKHRRAWVYVPVPGGTGTAELSVHLRPYLAGNHDSLDVTASIDGTPAARREYVLGQPIEPIEITLDRSRKPGELIELRFDLAYPTSPFRISAGSDTRTLGVHLTRVALEPGRTAQGDVPVTAGDDAIGAPGR